MYAQFQLTPSPAPNDGILFVDNTLSGRSSHMGHALAEYAPGCLLAFYSNVSGKRNDGHNGFGWMEYKRSEDGGKSWSEPIILDYSLKTFLDGLQTVTCEKAVSTDDGTIALFCCMNDSRAVFWRPWTEPQWLLSHDGGRTWGESRAFPRKGRIYDALYHAGEIYALEFVNDGTVKAEGTGDPSHVYRLYVSDDNGESFTERSCLPIDTLNKVYGTMEFLPDGTLIAYVYDDQDEDTLVYTLSRDNGRTWSPEARTPFAKQIRNPQMRVFNGCCFMYGRSGHYTPPQHFVLYTSLDGIHWDEGMYLCLGKAGHSFYANSLVTGRYDKNEKPRMLLQASDAYDKNRTNVKHWWIDDAAPAQK